MFRLSLAAAVVLAGFSLFGPLDSTEAQLLRGRRGCGLRCCPPRARLVCPPPCRPSYGCQSCCPQPCCPTIPQETVPCSAYSGPCYDICMTKTQVLGLEVTSCGGRCFPPYRGTQVCLRNPATGEEWCECCNADGTNCWLLTDYRGCCFSRCGLRGRGHCRLRRCGRSGCCCR